MPLRALFDGHTGKPIQKWGHYLEVYEKHFHIFVGKSPKILEIGVCDGGSLELWLKYFGTGCKVVGIDIDPRCKEFENEDIRIFIGDQTDREFLRAVIAESGPFDVVLDDGGHHMRQQIVSFEELFPATSPNGAYLVEDLHTSYWPEYGGGLNKSGTFIEYAKNFIDELNFWHLRDEKVPTNFTKSVTSMTFYDSVVVFEKTPRTAPFVIISDGSGKVQEPPPASNPEIPPIPPPFEITNSKVGYGNVAFGPDLGYDGSTVSNVRHCQWTVSAHGNSTLDIELHEPVSLVGFLNGTGERCLSAEFYVDDQYLGLCLAPHDATGVLRLAKGPHRLEVRAPHGEDFCHSVWGFDPAEEFLQPPAHHLAVAALWLDCQGLVEWLDHYLSLGVEHFYLLDGTDGEELEAGIAESGLSDVVTLEPWREKDRRAGSQIYQYLATKHAADCRWMAFLEPADFIIVKFGESLGTFLLAFEDYGALKIRRRNFVPTARLAAPEKAIGNPGSEAFFHDETVNYIVQPRFVQIVHSAHAITMLPGRREVGEHFDDGISDLHIQLNHYGTEPSQAVSELYRDHSIRHLWHRQELRASEQAVQPEEENGIPVFGYIHIAAVGQWRAILNSQLNKCVESGLWERTTEIRLGIVGGTASTLSELSDLPEKVKILFCDPELRWFEFPTLAALQGDCDEARPGYLWYVHSKGAVNSHGAQPGWRARMEEFVLTHYRLAVNKLRSGYRTAAGFGGPDARWYIPGNFYWLRSDHALSLPKVESLNWNNRWDAEKWVGMNGFEGMFFQDFGDTRLPELKILSSTAAAGVATTCGYHGWEDIPHGANRIPVLVPVSLPDFDLVLSAHAPSEVEIDLEREATVIGFVCASGRPSGWTLEFLVDGQSKGSATECAAPTEATVLSAGKHTLKVLAKGDTTGAHSVWGFLFSRK